MTQIVIAELPEALVESTIIQEREIFVAKGPAISSANELYSILSEIADNVDFGKSIKITEDSTMVVTGPGEWTLLITKIIGGIRRNIAYLYYNPDGLNVQRSAWYNFFSNGMLESFVIGDVQVRYEYVGSDIESARRRRVVTRLRTRDVDPQDDVEIDVETKYERLENGEWFNEKLLSGDGKDIYQKLYQKTFVNGATNTR